MSRQGSPAMLSRLSSLHRPLKSGQHWSNPVPTEVNKKTLPDITGRATSRVIGSKKPGQHWDNKLENQEGGAWRRNVKHAEEQQRTFVKVAAICPVEAKEMLSPPSWAQDGHTNTNDHPSWKWPFSRGWCTHPSSHSALLEMAQLTLMGMQARFPC